MNGTNSLLSNIISATNNDVILFTIVLICALLIVCIPFYRLMANRKKQETEAELKEKQLLIEVISKNTEAITSLQSTLEINNGTLIQLVQKIYDDTIVNSTSIQQLVTGQHHTDSTLLNLMNTENDIAIKLNGIADSIIKTTARRTKKATETK